MTADTLLDLFLSWCAEHRRPATVAHYRQRLKSFRRRFARREFADLTPLDVEQWLAQAARYPPGHKFAGDLMAADTRAATVRCFERLQAWALERELIARPITKRLEKPRCRPRERLPTEDETRALLAAARREFVFAYEALRQSGMRPSELAAAMVAHVDKTRMVIELPEHKTSGKTGRPRIIPIGARLRIILKKSLGGRTDGPLFLTPRGKPWTARSLSLTFRRLRKKAGLPDDLVLYLARHEHASVLTDKVGIHAAGAALGHADLRTTERYVKVNLEQMRRAQDSFQ